MKVTVTPDRIVASQCQPIANDLIARLDGRPGMLGALEASIRKAIGYAIR